jgi:hypothetical protein
MTSNENNSTRPTVVVGEETTRTLHETKMPLLQAGEALDDDQLWDQVQYPMSY